MRPVLTLGAAAGTAALATAGLLASGALGTATTPSTTKAAVTAADATPADGSSCNGVLSGAGAGQLDKKLVDVEKVSNGTYAFTFQLDSERAAGTYRLRDCVYIDNGTPGYQGEAVIAATDDKTWGFGSGTSGSTTQFRVTVSGINPGVLVCDRASVSGSAAGTGFTDKSNEVCVDPNNPPVVPEAAWAVALPLAAVGLTGAVLLYRRRQQLLAPVQVTTTS